MNNYHVMINNINSKFLSIKKDIIIALPITFNRSINYEVYLVFDSKDMLLNSNNILENNNNCIFIGINSPNNMIRFNDLATYTNDDVKILMTKYFPELSKSNTTFLGGNAKNYLAFITNEVLPFVINNYQLQIKNLNAIGCSLAAYFCLQMLYLSKLQFNKLLLFSPAIWFNPLIINDLTTKVLNNNQPLTVQLWVGKKEPKFFEGKVITNYEKNTIELQKILTNRKIISNLVIDENGAHGFKWWIKYINENPFLLSN
ncbi:alpha/beta hydrolase-fold protein [Spiroplasma endosymbiont of Polydrusus pterygomalis]|uniref:alpha/beta hydrolase-fold protein n=1 Tax=Spiroplasma endosymbiont of Polydrusus pterygomalis TaxID=3139327 RepID=UPI003CCAA28A